MFHLNKYSIYSIGTIILSGLILYNLASMFVQSHFLTQTNNKGLPIKEEVESDFTTQNGDISFTLPKGWSGHPQKELETYQTFGELDEAWTFSKSQEIVQFDLVIIEEFDARISPAILCQVASVTCEQTTYQDQTAVSYTDVNKNQTILVPFGDSLVIFHWRGETSSEERQLLENTIRFKES